MMGDWSDAIANLCSLVVYTDNVLPIEIYGRFGKSVSMIYRGFEKRMFKGKFENCEFSYAHSAR